jgi:L-threonylcarbamoyladenylate synthase
MGKIGTSIDLAVEHLQQGRIVAFPTETYYGLAVDPNNGSAVEALFNLKKRPVNKPLLLLVKDTSQLSRLISSTPPEFMPLMAKFWPGPLTLIFPAHPLVNSKITAGTGTVGIRISPHQVAENIVRDFGGAITATSANVSGLYPATTAQEVVEMFGDDIDYVFDGGGTTAGLCSTIIGVKESQLLVIRAGEIDIFSS